MVLRTQINLNPRQRIRVIFFTWYEVYVQFMSVKLCLLSLIRLSLFVKGACNNPAWPVSARPDEMHDMLLELPLSVLQLGSVSPYKAEQNQNTSGVPFQPSCSP